MSDLADLAYDVTGDMPASVRKVIATAMENGWQLNPPGMTVSLRLNHPTDDLAQPVYITWAIGRTPKGSLSFRFMSCGTAGLTPLSGADLLEYLADPTVIYRTDEELEADYTEHEDKHRKKWDKSAEVTVNLRNQLGAEVIGIEVQKPVRQPSRTKPPVKVSSKPLRVQIPGR